ncbi:bifunctional metallophosphatase/5'-nucleotidase [Alicyclobacillus acidocaldarius]|uniref:Metallophosphoesterase n=1 Tax=Alicyclobacillus acidocaldarius subsp. acidocaldarius (strain ATCC 27009 / DSM 446 / BCRC 14685 / JCM 5260 / KCTC 1825 / NBRC 15652 / NCIMB 11725 / NRRL B-14509 / 104-IA) TaxID=521098 RepID=C8WS60_ALIAD|nr:5'-nucleotidase C-terminal domain-containing protein [Alicyclobacillus acidocaldarius]ACV57494.1 metallophosphoesterase [Alicyclobacillus acidocaldarius subsp. acidocaldarius DSM 446]
MRIHLLHMNDLHSRLENHMRIGAKIRALRAEFDRKGEASLTFDLGDVLDRVRPETEATCGLLNADFMRALGVDGWIFGNNEGLTIPVERWEELVKRSGAIAFGTNLRRSDGSPFSFFRDTHVYEVGGMRIGAFGLTPNYDLPYHMLGVHVLDPIEAARRAVDQLVAQRVDAIVCLSHMGLRFDRALASELPQITCVLGGHTHETMHEAEYVGHTAVFQPGKHGFSFGHTVLERSGGRVAARSERIPVEPWEPLDARMMQVYAREQAFVERQLGHTVAALSDRLQLEYEDECTFANLLTDILYDAFEGDLALMMAGALNASLLPGTVAMVHVLGACPTPTRPIVVTMRGADILEAIDLALKPEIHNRQGIGFGFRGGRIGVLAISGALAEIEHRADGRRVRRVVLGGRPLEPDRDYRVITCEYLWLSPVFPPFRRARDVTYQRPLVRELLIEHIGDPGRVERARLPRYEVVDPVEGRTKGAWPS